MDERQAIEVLQEVKTFLENHDVTFWLDYGTLLGAARNGKFIPWDHDIDIGIWKNDVDTLAPSLKELETKGYSLHFNYHLQSHEYTVVALHKNDVCIGLNIYTEQNNNAVTKWFTHIRLGQLQTILQDPHNTEKNTLLTSLVSLCAQRLSNKMRKRLISMLQYVSLHMGWYKEIILSVPCDYFINLEKMNFYHMSFNVPSNYKKYLTIRYGKQWRIPNKDYVHLTDDGAIQ